MSNDVAEYVDDLNKELDMFRKIFNRRVVYFAALQEISDSVKLPYRSSCRMTWPDSLGDSARVQEPGARDRESKRRGRCSRDDSS